MKRRILVFPCGSEIGLEIHRSMCFSAHFELIGASSVDDHGRFVFEQYVGNLPFHNASDFADRIREVAKELEIDAIYPAMDAVAETLHHLAHELPCKVIGSDARATAICASKNATYDALEMRIPTPRRFATIDEIPAFPVFIKPDRGYGARNTARIPNADAAEAFLAAHRGSDMLLLEYLPGKEWTVDCFSDRHGVLRFHGVRGRNRISNGISVNTTLSDEFSTEFAEWAEAINEVLKPRGAWFFQAKQDSEGRPKLLEVAARLGGSSGIFRCLGVNFALLSAFDAFDQEVGIRPNSYSIEFDRALSNRCKLDIAYRHVFVDLDDCLIVDGKINQQLVGFIFKAISEGKGVTLITRHHRDPLITLREHRIGDLFDRIVHITGGEGKSEHIDRMDSIFIDDSFAERENVAKVRGIPVFSPDMIEALL